MIDNMKDIKALLAHLPYRASFYDNNLKLIYSNHRSDGSFFTENESEKLPYIQDLRPLLSSYLKETSQAIVAWSDTTSGPSIGNDL